MTELDRRGEAVDDRQRGPQLVTDRRDEVLLQRVQGLESVQESPVLVDGTRQGQRLPGVVGQQLDGGHLRRSVPANPLATDDQHADGFAAHADRCGHGRGQPQRPVVLHPAFVGAVVIRDHCPILRQRAADEAVRRWEREVSEVLRNLVGRAVAEQAVLVEEVDARDLAGDSRRCGHYRIEHSLGIAGRGGPCRVDDDPQGPVGRRHLAPVGFLLGVHARHDVGREAGHGCARGQAEEGEHDLAKPVTRRGQRGRDDDRGRDPDPVRGRPQGECCDDCDRQQHDDGIGVVGGVQEVRRDRSRRRHEAQDEEGGLLCRGAEPVPPLAEPEQDCHAQRRRDDDRPDELGRDVITGRRATADEGGHAGHERQDTGSPAPDGRASVQRHRWKAGRTVHGPESVRRCGRVQEVRPLDCDRWWVDRRRSHRGLRHLGRAQAELELRPLAGR